MNVQHAETSAPGCVNGDLLQEAVTSFPQLVQRRGGEQLILTSLQFPRRGNITAVTAAGMSDNNGQTAPEIQVWRPQSPVVAGDRYLLVSSARIDPVRPTNTNERSFQISFNASFSVESGDVLGLFLPGGAAGRSALDLVFVESEESRGFVFGSVQNAPTVRRMLTVDRDTSRLEAVPILAVSVKGMLAVFGARELEQPTTHCCLHVAVCTLLCTIIIPSHYVPSPTHPPESSYFTLLINSSIYPLTTYLHPHTLLSPHTSHY